MLKLVLSFVITSYFQADSSKITPSPPAPDLVAGHCIGKNKTIDIGKTAYLENKQILWTNEKKSFLVSLHDETVRVEPIKSLLPSPVHIYNIGHLVSPKSDIDIRLKLALIDNELYIYWRETFEHRSYRQGMFHVSGEKLTPLCEGTGGLDRSH